MGIRSYLQGVVIVLGIIPLVMLVSKGCHSDKPVETIINNPVVSITPVVDHEKLGRLPELPNNEKPVYAIPVPTPKVVVGKDVTANIVVSDKGNTFVVYSESVDWGFRFEPKASVAVSDKVLLGADVTFFTYWRINADALIYIPMIENLSVTQTRVGLGASYKINNNTSVGVGYLKDFSSDSSLCIFAALKF